MAKGKSRKTSKTKEVLRRTGKSFAAKMKERRTRGLAISLATAAAAGWYEAGKDDAERALFNQSGKSVEEQRKAIQKTDAVGLVAAAYGIWSGNELAMDVALGLLPCTVRRMVENRANESKRAAGGGRPPPAGKIVGELADDTALAGSLPVDALIGDQELESMVGYDDELGGAVEVEGDQELESMAGYDHELGGAVQVEDY